MSCTHYRSCHLCEAICGLKIEVDQGVITSIRGDDKDPLSKGHICPKAVALKDLHTDPDRLRQPMRRTPDGWQPMTWDEAFDLVVSSLSAIRERHGADAIAVYQGNPTVHNLGSMLAVPPFVRALGTRWRYSATSVDQLPHQFVAAALYGHQLMLPVPDVDRTDFFLLLGGNPAVSNSSMMTAPNIRARLKAVSARGGRVVLVDPRRTKTAKLADTHLFIRPGTDALLLASMVHTLFDEGLVDVGRLEPIVRGLDDMRTLVSPFTPELVAAKVSIDATTIRQLTRDFAAAPSAVAHGRMGVSTQVFGGLCQWFVHALNLLTGNLDREGGAMFTHPAVPMMSKVSRGRHGRWHSRVRGLPEFGGELPVSTLAEEIVTPGEAKVRGLVTSAGNPVLSTPDSVGMDRALASLEFMVSVDMYINETTRHAHVILPPASPLERPHYDLLFYVLAVRNVARYSPPLFDKPAGTLDDGQIFEVLERRMANGDDVRAKMERKVRHGLGTLGQLRVALRAGPYGKGLRPTGEGLSLSHLKKNPHGVDLGPLRPCLPKRLRTGEVNLAPDVLLADVPRLLAALQAPPNTSMVLIGRRHLRSNNSWMHNSERLVRGKPRCTLLVHPIDAQRLGLEQGVDARVRSRVGELVAPVHISDEVMPGVVSLPHGWGHDRQGVVLGVAVKHAGVSFNDLTDPQQLDELTGNAVLNGVQVEVCSAHEPINP